MRRSVNSVGVIARLAVIVVLAGCAWYVWVRDPLRPDNGHAAQFCKSVVAGTPVIAIMKAAAEKGATDFVSPQTDLLVVAFGDSTCSLWLRDGAFSGEISSAPAG